MKFATVLPFVVGALAGLSRRQNTPDQNAQIISQQIQNLVAATNTLNTQVLAFQGDITDVQDATNNVLATISAAQAAISPIPDGQITGFPLLQLSSDTQNLNAAVSQAVNSTIDQKPAFVAGGFGPTILAALQQQQAVGNDLQALIIRKLDPAVQDFAAQQSTTAASLQRGIDAFADQAVTTTTTTVAPTTTTEAPTTTADATTTTDSATIGIPETTTTAEASPETTVTDSTTIVVPDTTTTTSEADPETTLTVSDSTTIVVPVTTTTTTEDVTDEPTGTDAPVYPTKDIPIYPTDAPIYPTDGAPYYPAPYHPTTVCPTASATIPYYPTKSGVKPTYGCDCKDEPAFSAPVTYVTYCPKPTEIVWYGSTVVVEKPKTITLEYTKTVVVDKPTVVVTMPGKTACPSKPVEQPQAPKQEAPKAPEAPKQEAPKAPEAPKQEAPKAPAPSSPVQQIPDGQVQVPAKPSSPASPAAPSPSVEVYKGAAASVNAGAFGAFAVAAIAVAAF